MQNIFSNDQELTVGDILALNGDSQHGALVEKLAMNVSESPVLIFKWENVDSFFKSAIELHRNGLSPPFPLSVNASLNDFKQALLSFIKGDQTVPDPVGTTLFYGEPLQIAFLMNRASLLVHHPWARGIACVEGTTPIARLYSLPIGDDVAVQLMEDPLEGPPLWRAAEDVARIRDEGGDAAESPGAAAPPAHAGAHAG